MLSIIKKRLVRKAIDMLKEASEDAEKAKRLNQNFSRYIKVARALDLCRAVVFCLP